MRIIIAGWGPALYFVCPAFLAKGHDVTVVSPDAEECVRLAREIKAGILCGDASEPDVLERARALEADVVLAITPKDQVNLAVCQLARLRYQVPRCIALANDPDNEPVFRELGVISFSLIPILASLIEQRTVVDEITNLVPIGEGRVLVTEVSIGRDSPAADQLVQAISLPEEAVLACVIRQDEPIIPRGGTRLRRGDRVLLVTLPESHGAALRVFTGGD